MDYASIVLDEAEWAELEKAAVNGTAIPVSDASERLAKLGLVRYVRNALGTEPGYLIADDGMNYVRFHKRDEADRSNLKRQFRITTGVSVAALVLSLIAIVVSILK